MIETERMPSLVGANTELGGGKPKNCKGKSKPSFEPGPNSDSIFKNGNMPIHCLYLTICQYVYFVLTRFLFIIEYIFHN